MLSMSQWIQAAMFLLIFRFQNKKNICFSVVGLSAATKKNAHLWKTSLRQIAPTPTQTPKKLYAAENIYSNDIVILYADGLNEAIAILNARFGVRYTYDNGDVMELRADPYKSGIITSLEK